jgi:hypothetical protein
MPTEDNNSEEIDYNNYNEYDGSQLQSEEENLKLFKF